MKKGKVLKLIQNEIVISCQAYQPNPFATVEDMVKMAKAAVMAGAKGLRVNHPDYVSAIREEVGDEVVIIGIWKEMIEGSDVYITLTMDAVDSLVEAGSNIIALDCTNRVNAYGYKGYDLVPKIKEKYPDIVVMADCANIVEVNLAKDAGVDVVSCTLSGYTKDTSHLKSDEPDFDLIQKMSLNEDVFVIAEGKVWTREEAIKCFESGADAVVIGTAITSPWKIAQRFLKSKNEYFEGEK
jgi:N-acylglucosamine-6-phosphate 2-epimerase